MEKQEFKEEFIQVRASKDFKERLKRVAQALEIPGAQLMREATAEKITELAKKNPKVKEALAL